MQGGVERVPHGVGDGGFVDMAKRGDIGVVIGRNGHAVADRKAVELTAGLPIPCCFMRLAQACQVEPERLPLFIANTMSLGP